MPMPDRQFEAMCSECGEKFRFTVRKTVDLPVTKLDCATAMAGGSEELKILEENPTTLPCKGNVASGVTYKHIFNMDLINVV